jgi:TatA/E family protein of Tat protein translocase
MHVPVILAMWGGMEIPIIVGAAILLFGGSKIRDVARGLGAAKKEFQVGQAEADIAAERARAEARAQAEANAAAAATTPAAVAPPVGPPPVVTPPAP